MSFYPMQDQMMLNKGRQFLSVAVFDKLEDWVRSSTYLETHNLHVDLDV